MHSIRNVIAACVALAGLSFVLPSLWLAAVTAFETDGRYFVSVKERVVTVLVCAAVTALGLAVLLGAAMLWQSPWL